MNEAAIREALEHDLRRRTGRRTNLDREDGRLTFGLLGSRGRYRVALAALDALPTSPLRFADLPRAEEPRR